MDPVQAQAQKKQSLLRNQYLYDKEMADESGMTMYLSEAELSAYDTAAPQEKANAVFVRQKLRDMMLVDEKSAEDLKEEYRDVWDEAQKEKQDLQTDASRTGLNKARHDLMGKKKKAAQARLKKIEDAKVSLERGKIVRDKQQRIMNITGQVDTVFQQKRDQMMALREQEYLRAQEIRRKAILAAGGTEEDFQKELEAERSRLEYAMKANMIQITEDMSPEQRKEAEKKNAEVYDYFNRLKQKELQLEAKYEQNRGGFQQKTALFSISDESQGLVPLIDRYKKEHPDISEGDVLRSDVFRDCCRWISKRGHAHEANTDEMYLAIKHLKTLREDTDAGAMADKNTTVEAVRYIHGKINGFIGETEEIRDRCPSLFGANPDYGNLIQYAEEINGMYKKSQSVEGIAQAIVTDKAYMDTLAPEDQKALKDKWAYCRAAMSKFTELFTRGRLCDKIVRDGGFPDEGNPPPLASFDEKYQTNVSTYDKDLADKEAKKQAEREAQAAKAQAEAQRKEGEKNDGHGPA